jgi:alkylation response protein AidB-like acyl-CoA dehydrogenase
LSVFNNCAKHGERMPRDAKIHTILGTSDFQQLVIARAISGLRVE